MFIMSRPWGCWRTIQCVQKPQVQYRVHAGGRRRVRDRLVSRLRTRLGIRVNSIWGQLLTLDRIGVSA